MKINISSNTDTGDEKTCHKYERDDQLFLDVHLKIQTAREGYYVFKTSLNRDDRAFLDAHLHLRYGQQGDNTVKNDVDDRCSKDLRLEIDTSPFIFRVPPI